MERTRALRLAHDAGEARELINMGANPNARADDSGDTPLREQCSLGNVEVVRFLLEHGADPTVRDNYGQTILQSIEQEARNHTAPEDARYAQVRALLARALAGHKQPGNPP